MDALENKRIKQLFQNKKDLPVKEIYLSNYLILYSKYN